MTYEKVMPGQARHDKSGLELATGSTNPRNDTRDESSRTACVFYCRADAVMRSAQ
jgi:hypothetical protein